MPFFGIITSNAIEFFSSFSENFAYGFLDTIGARQHALFQLGVKRNGAEHAARPFDGSIQIVEGVAVRYCADDFAAKAAKLRGFVYNRRLSLSSLRLR
jgi:hypothetical protein